MRDFDPSSHPESGTHPRRGRVLIVDDEPYICDALALVLSDLHAVVVAHSGLEALEAIAGGDAFDVILCDVMMPRMNGMQLYDRLQAEAPGQAARIVFTTGCALLPEVRAFLDRVPNACVDKPFDVNALRAFVERRVGSPASERSGT